jgi:hypothetical protein
MYRKQCSLWEIVQRESVKTMPRELLKAAEVPKLIAFNRGKGKFRNGAGLYLDVRAPVQASWAYQFRLAGRTLWGSIGPASIYSLADARDKHRDLRRVVHEGKDPRAGAGEAVGASFEVALTDYLANASPEWKGGTEGKEAGDLMRVGRLSFLFDDDGKFITVGRVS